MQPLFVLEACGHRSPICKETTCIISDFLHSLGNFPEIRGQCTLLLNGSVTNETVKEYTHGCNDQSHFEYHSLCACPNKWLTNEPTQLFFFWRLVVKEKLTHRMHKHSSCRLHHNVSGKAAYLELEKQLGTLLTKPSLTGWCWTNSQFKQKQENHNPRIDFIAWHIMSGILNKWEVISLCLQLCTVNVALKELSEIEITRTRGYSGVTHTWIDRH